MLLVRSGSCFFNHLWTRLSVEVKFLTSLKDSFLLSLKFHVEALDIWSAFLRPNVLSTRILVRNKGLGLVGYQPNLMVRHLVSANFCPSYFFSIRPKFSQPPPFSRKNTTRHNWRFWQYIPSLWFPLSLNPIIYAQQKLKSDGRIITMLILWCLQLFYNFWLMFFSTM